MNNPSLILVNSPNYQNSQNYPNNYDNSNNSTQIAYSGASAYSQPVSLSLPAINLTKQQNQINQFSQQNQTINNLTTLLGQCTITDNENKILFPNISKKLTSIPADVISLGLSSVKNVESESINSEKKRIADKRSLIEQSKMGSLKAIGIKAIQAEEIKAYCKVFDIKCTGKTKKNENIDMLLRAIDNYKSQFKAATSTQIAVPTNNYVNPNQIYSSLPTGSTLLRREGESDDESVEFDEFEEE